MTHGPSLYFGFQLFTLTAIAFIPMLNILTPSDCEYGPVGKLLNYA